MEAKVVHLKRCVPSGEVTENDFEIRSVTISTALEEGEVLFRALVLSADPYQRGRFKAETSVGPVEGFLAGVVEESRNATIKKGSL